jgi:hypothetical protein
VGVRWVVGRGGKGRGGEGEGRGGEWGQGADTSGENDAGLSETRYDTGVPVERALTILIFGLGLFFAGRQHCTKTSRSRPVF